MDNAQTMSLNEVVVSKRWLMWFSAALFYFYQFILRVSPSVMTVELQSYLMVSGCALGVLTSLYYWGYSMFQVPVGLIMDRVGTRLPLTVACSLCALGCLLFYSGSNITVMAIGRFFMGVGSAFGFLSALKIATLWLPVEKHAFVIGLTMLMGTSGASFAGAPLRILIDMFSWQTCILILGLFSAALGTFIWTTVKDHSSQSIKFEQIQSEKMDSIFETVKAVLRKPQTWLIGLYGGMMYVPLSGFADLWGVPYISKIYNVDANAAAGAISWFYIGLGIGAPILSYSTEYIKSHKKMLIISAVGTFIFLTASLYCTAVPFSLTYFLFALGGFFSSGQFIAFSTVTFCNEKKNSGTASGIHNMLCMISGILFQPLIGYMLDFVSGSSGGEAQSYAIRDFMIALSVVPISLVISAMLALFIVETYGRR